MARRRLRGRFTGGDTSGSGCGGLGGQITSTARKTAYGEATAINPGAKYTCTSQVAKRCQRVIISAGSDLP